MDVLSKNKVWMANLMAAMCGSCRRCSYLTSCPVALLCRGFNPLLQEARQEGMPWPCSYPDKYKTIHRYLNYSSLFFNTTQNVEYLSGAVNWTKKLFNNETQILNILNLLVLNFFVDPWIWFCYIKANRH